MVGLAIIENRHDLAIALYLGFAGMLRASELCFLKLAHINVIGPLSAIISLRESKTAVRMANAEAELIKDACLVSLLKYRIGRGNPQDALIGVRYNELSTIIQEYVSFSARLTHKLLLIGLGEEEQHGISRDAKTSMLCRH